MKKGSLRKALSHFATGIAVITTFTPNKNSYGVTVNSFTSVSLDPPIILFSLKKNSILIDLIEQSGFFGVNILSSCQQELAERFSRDEESKDLLGISLTNSKVLSPLFKNALATFDCQWKLNHEGGDHVIILGDVKKFHLGKGLPLLYFRSNYTRLGKMN